MMSKQSIRIWAFISYSFLILCLFAGLAQADVLLVDSVSDAHSRHLPRTGLRMEQVRAEWGEPESQHPAVGSPPITRWDFAEFSVYFEYDHVISSVLNKGEVLKNHQP